MAGISQPCGSFWSVYLYLAPSVTLFNGHRVGDIMTEYCYPECTTSVITSLAIFRKHYSHYRAEDIEFVHLLY